MCVCVCVCVCVYIIMCVCVCVCEPSVGIFSPLVPWRSSSVSPGRSLGRRGEGLQRGSLQLGGQSRVVRRRRHRDVGQARQTMAHSMIERRISV